MSDSPTRWLDQPDITIVTGAAGWLGTSLVASLTQGEWRRSGTIRALVHNAADAARISAFSTPDTKVEITIGDITTVADVARLLDTPTAATVDVIHTVGVIHPNNIAMFSAVNVSGTANIVTAANDRGVRRFVHVSSNSPFGTNAHVDDRFGRHEPYRPYLAYGRSKMEAELVVTDTVSNGLNAVIVRPPWFYGPYQPARQTRFFSLVRSGRFPIFGNGDQQRSMVYLDNLVQGVVRAELVDTAPGQGWWIADRRPYTVREIVDTVASALAAAGYSVRRQRVRVPVVVGDIAEGVDRALQRSGRYSSAVHVLGELNKNIACDISAAAADLGYTPTVDLAEGMARSIAWCQQMGYRL